MLSEHDFLNEEECKTASTIVHQLKNHWINRAGSVLPFFTLGAASYLDAKKDDQTAYLQAAARDNPILTANFPLIYEKLTETLSDILKVPVAYDKSFAYPSFHIFLAAKCFENPIASIHFDLQYEHLKWNYKDIDFDHPISFTCPIVLPASSGGLNYWDIGVESKNLNRNEIKSLIDSKEKHYFPYHIGKLVLHNGLIIHQIAPTLNMQPDDERITLQGHGLFCDGMMRLYW